MGRIYFEKLECFFQKSNVKTSKFRIAFFEGLKLQITASGNGRRTEGNGAVFLGGGSQISRRQNARLPFEKTRGCQEEEGGRKGTLY